MGTGLDLGFEVRTAKLRIYTWYEKSSDAFVQPQSCARLHSTLFNRACLSYICTLSGQRNLHFWGDRGFLPSGFGYKVAEFCAALHI